MSLIEKIPGICLLEYANNKTANSKEAYWISLFKENGFELLNSAPGSFLEISDKPKFKIKKEVAIRWMKLQHP